MIGSLFVSAAFLIPLARYANREHDWNGFLIGLGAYILGGVSYGLWLIH